MLGAAAKKIQRRMEAAARLARTKMRVGIGVKEKKRLTLKFDVLEEVMLGLKAGAGFAVIRGSCGGTIICCGSGKCGKG